MVTSFELISPAGDIGILNPTFAGTVYSGSSGNGQIIHFTLEVRRSSDNVLMTSEEFTVVRNRLATDFYVSFASLSLSSAVTYKWRLSGGYTASEPAESAIPSGYVTFTPYSNTTPTVTQSSPVYAAQVSTLTPTFTFSFTDPDTYSNYGTFSAFQVKVRRKSDSVSFWDSGSVATSGSEQTAKAASKVYAGTTLVSNTTYQWQVRVQDGNGAWSGYSSWWDFTPVLAPSVPTSITPNGKTDSLTPTISGVYNAGIGGTESAYQYEIRQGLTTTIYQSGDVTGNIATGQAFGTNNSADTPSTPPSLAWGVAYYIRVRSKDNVGAYSDWSTWQLFTTNQAPTTPTSISPSGGALTSDQTPTISWAHNDPDGDAQTAVDIELYDLTAAAYVTGYNPKTLSQATLTHDETETLTLTNNYRMRIRTKGLAGPGYGPWSDYALFTVVQGPTIGVTYPAVDEVIPSSGFSAIWTFSGGSGTQQDYRIKVFADDQVTQVYDSGVIAGTELTLAVPAGTLSNGNTYYFQLTVRDTLSQSAMSDLIPITTSFTPPATLTGLAVTAIGGD